MKIVLSKNPGRLYIDSGEPTSSIAALEQRGIYRAYYPAEPIKTEYNKIKDESNEDNLQ